MTPDEHQKHLRALQRARNAAKEASKTQPLDLAGKLAILKEVKKLDAKIHSHKLNFFELTAPPVQVD